MRRLLLFLLLLLTVLAGCGSQTERDPRLAEILGAPVPPGVSPKLWHELTRELAKVVAANPRTASAPPSNLASATTLEYDIDLGVLTWGYYFSGDYDQNGVVSVSDLTPLAIHLGESVTDVDSSAGVCDGDGNLEVTVADLTPIGVNLGKHIAGYRIYSADSEAPYPALPTAPNGNGATLAGDVLFSEAIGDKASQRLAFSFDIPAPVADTYYWVRPYDGADDGTPSNNLLVPPGTPPVNQPPVAVLNATPGSGATPLKVHLSGAASSDDRGIAKYEWDLNGDGIYEYNGGTIQTTTQWYYGPGTFTVGLRVTDSDGTSSTRTATVNASEGAKWQETHFLEQQAQKDFISMGQWMQGLDISGRPALAYYWFTGTPDNAVQIRVSKANNELGTSWSAPQVLIDNQGDGSIVYSPIAAGVINGVPTVYAGIPDPGNPGFELWAYQSQDEGSTWDTPIIVDATCSLQNSVSKLLFASKPILFHFNNPFAYLTYLGADGLTVEGNYNSADALPFRDLAVQGTRPIALSTYANQIFVRQANDDSGTVWPTFPVSVYETPFDISEAQIGVAGGHACVAFRSTSLDRLDFCRAQDDEAQTWPAPTIVDIWTEPPVFLGESEDVPFLIYKDGGTDSLLFTKANQPEGLTWSVPVKVVDYGTATWKLVSIDEQPRLFGYYYSDDNSVVPAMRTSYFIQLAYR